MLNNFLIFVNALACFLVGYVTLGLLVAMRRPESWKGWLERVSMAAVVGASVFAGIAPIAMGYIPYPWTIVLNACLATWFWFMFHRTAGWKKHITDNFDYISEFLKNLPDRVNNAKLCWNERVDKMRDAP